MANVPILFSHSFNSFNPAHIISFSRKSTLKNGIFLMTHTIIDSSDVKTWVRRSIQPLLVHIKCSGRTQSPMRRKSGNDTGTVWLQGLFVKRILCWVAGLWKKPRNPRTTGDVSNEEPGSETCMAYIMACTSPRNAIFIKFRVPKDLTKQPASFLEDVLRSSLSSPQSFRVSPTHLLMFIISGKCTTVHLADTWGRIAVVTCNVTKTMMKVQTPQDVRVCMVAASGDSFTPYRMCDVADM